MTEIEHLRSENARLQDLLDRRPAMNEGLPEAYVAGREHSEVN